MGTESLLVILMAVSLMSILILAVIMYFSLAKRLGDIEGCLENKYVKFDPSMDDLVTVARTYWRIGEIIRKSGDTLGESNLKKMQSFERRLKKVLDGHFVEVKDYAGDPYNVGQHDIECIETVVDENTKRARIQEMREPAIWYKNKIISKGQVVVLAGKE